MIIEFDFGDYDVICDKYEDLFYSVESLYTKEINDISFVVNAYRVIMPELHISFRHGTGYQRTDDEDEEWEPIDEAYLFYEEDEKNVDEFFDAVGEEVYYFLDSLIKENKLEIKSEALKCYIDTDEFAPNVQIEC